MTKWFRATFTRVNKLQASTNSIVVYGTDFSEIDDAINELEATERRRSRTLKRLNDAARIAGFLALVPALPWLFRSMLEELGIFPLDLPWETITPALIAFGLCFLTVYLVIALIRWNIRKRSRVGLERASVASGLVQHLRRMQDDSTKHPSSFRLVDRATAGEEDFFRAEVNVAGLGPTIVTMSEKVLGDASTQTREIQLVAEIVCVAERRVGFRGGDQKSLASLPSSFLHEVIEEPTKQGMRVSSEVVYRTLDHHTESFDLMVVPAIVAVLEHLGARKNES